MNPSPLNMGQQNPSFVPTWLGSVVHAFFGAVFRLGPKRLTWLGSAIYAFLGAVFLLGPYSIAPWLGRVLDHTHPPATAIIILVHFVLDMVSFFVALMMFILSIVYAHGAAHRQGLQSASK
jgi:hypothetical protein